MTLSFLTHDNDYDYSDDDNTGKYDDVSDEDINVVSSA